MQYQCNLYTAESVHLIGYNSVADNSLWVYLYSISRCWLANLWNFAKFRENSKLSRSRSSKVIDLDVNGSAHATSY